MAQLGPSREAKHIVLMAKMADVRASIQGLEDLANRIDPMPPTPSNLKPNEAIPMPSLANFLNNSGADLADMRDRIEKAISRIQEAVL